MKPAGDRRRAVCSPRRASFGAQGRGHGTAPCIRTYSGASASGGGAFDVPSCLPGPVRNGLWLQCGFCGQGCARQQCRPGPEADGMETCAQAVAQCVKLWLEERMLDSAALAFMRDSLELHEAQTWLTGHGPDAAGCVPVPEALLEYLCFPDGPLEQAVEAALQRCGAAAGCFSVYGLAAAVCARLGEPRITISRPAAHGDTGWSVCAVLSAEMTEKLVGRLRLERITAPVAADCGSRGENGNVKLRLYLRRLRLGLTPFRCAMLRQYVECMPQSDPLFYEGLDVWAQLLESAGDWLQDAESGKEALFAALSARHTRLARSLREAREFALRLRRYNMETLMMQGIRPPAEDEDALQRGVQMLERISVAVFRKLPAGAGIAEHDLGSFGNGMSADEFDPAAEVRELMRLLS